MTQKKVSRTIDVDLRLRAEEFLGEKSWIPPPAETGEDSLRLLHELQVHQIELEMQNAELSRARDEIEIVLEKYTDLYDFAPVGYFTLDRNGAILAANLTVAGILGIERSRLIGRRFADFLPAETNSVFPGFLGKVFTSQAKETHETALLKDGNFRLFVQIEAMVAASGQECRFALIDISVRKKSEEAIHQAREAAEATARTKRQFLANMSHELRTPMSGILGMLQLSLEKELAPELRDYLETALNSARSLLRILNDILDTAKIEAGKLTIIEEPFSPRKCISEAFDFVTPELRRKGLDFSVSVTEDVPDKVVGDQMRLRQVLANLIGNAVKFTENGKISVRVAAGATTSDGKREFTFAVTDTGIGIPDNKKALLFQAFSQVDASSSRRYGGTGLGLVISSEIVKLMGGTISFESEEGVGSSFSFTIPLGEYLLESDPPLAVESPTSKLATPARQGDKVPRILLAEDDPANRKILGAMLKHANYNIDFAENGLKALEMWEKGGYDLVLMDVQMPGLDGFEATRAIREKERERGCHTIIVAMTAHARKEDEEVCLDAGMDAYLSKPIDFSKSLKLIGELILV